MIAALDRRGHLREIKQKLTAVQRDLDQSVLDGDVAVAIYSASIIGDVLAVIAHLLASETSR